MTGTASFVSLSIITAKPMPQFGMATAVQLAPFGLRTVDQVRPIGEGAHEGDREPVAGRFAEASLVLYVVRQVRQGIPLCLAALVGDRLVASRERYRLEARGTR